jgi:hypothetical protein
MRITSANIPAPANKLTISTVSPAAADYPKASQASDSYKKNSNPQIIDAEYVEFYSPSVHQFNQERQNLDSRIEPDAPRFEAPGTVEMNKAPAVQKYNLKIHDAPPPGSYIDLFA